MIIDIPFLMIFFVFTAASLIMATIKMLAAILGNGVTLPNIIPFTDVTPTRHFIMYPSIMFQVWFWAERLGVFVQ